MYYNYYWSMVLAYLKFNRISINDFNGYSFNIKADIIKIHTRRKIYKIAIRNLEQFYFTMKGDK